MLMPSGPWRTTSNATLRSGTHSASVFGVGAAVLRGRNGVTFEGNEASLPSSNVSSRLAAASATACATEWDGDIDKLLFAQNVSGAYAKTGAAVKFKLLKYKYNFELR